VTKTELVDKVAKSTNATKTEVAETLEAIIETIKQAIKEENKVTLIGFGTFSVTDRKARKGRNPKTGEPIDIPASRVPKFSPSETFKKELT